MCKTSMYIAYMYNDSQLQRYKRQPGNDFCTMHTKIVIIIICILNENFKRTTPFGLLQLQNTARIWIMDISGIWMTCLSRMVYYSNGHLNNWQKVCYSDA